MSDYAYDASAQELYLSAGTPRSRLNTLEGAVANKANKVDLTNISITGTTNNTGATISSGTFFYKDGDLVKAKTSIANGATLTLNTNYEVVTAGGLNDLNASLSKYEVTSIDVTTNASGEFDFGVNANNAYVMCAFASTGATVKIDVYKSGALFYGKALTIAGSAYASTAIKVFFLKYYV